MFGRRLLNNKQHRSANEAKTFINNYNFTNKNKNFNEEIKFNEEKESEIPIINENKNQKNIKNDVIPESINKNEIKEKKK